ncbi:STAS/SEC14 domain-containing protein [Flavobacterium chungangense]|uniref:STAS/SEC14 domain-containing protein n=2 Tax=Flavobacterium chungangense TaxID=554283 RepID=A0A6V6YYT8_9FLAO|nr:STAS/SEC14 domain-containing protein [Flavobacterium chungangense]
MSHIFVKNEFNLQNLNVMIEKIKELPENMIGFKTAGHVVKGDVDFVKSEVRLLIDETSKLNYLLFFDNSPTDFALGAWLHESLLSIKNITKWTRAAIVTDCQRMINFTKVFNTIMPGEFKGFKKEDYMLAIDWTSEKIDLD